MIVLLPEDKSENNRGDPKALLSAKVRVFGKYYPAWQRIATHGHEDVLLRAGTDGKGFAPVRVSLLL